MLTGRRKRRPLQDLQNALGLIVGADIIRPRRVSALASLSYALRAAFGGCATHAHCGGCDEGGGKNRRFLTEGENNYPSVSLAADSSSPRSVTVGDISPRWGESCP